MPISCIRILLLGDTTVGKSSLISQFADNKFDSHINFTIGLDYKIKMVDIDGQQIKIQIWDTSGQERFHTITDSYYRGAHAVMLVYDITRPSSYENISKWIDNIHKHGNDEVPKVLVGNKTDLPQRAISKIPARVFADAYNMHFFETSAKNNDNVAAPFLALIKDVLALVPYEPEAEQLVSKEDKNPPKREKKEKKEKINNKQLANRPRIWSFFKNLSCVSANNS